MGGSRGTRYVFWSYFGPKENTIVANPFGFEPKSKNFHFQNVMILEIFCKTIIILVYFFVVSISLGCFTSSVVLVLYTR